MQVVFFLIDLLQHSNAEVVKAADQALTVISDTDEEWAAKLGALKFEAHNQIWLEACANGTAQQVRYGGASLCLRVLGCVWCECMFSSMHFVMLPQGPWCFVLSKLLYTVADL